VSEEEPRIGVYVCHCGLNIAGVVDVEEVAEYAKTLPNVVIARHYVYMCSEPGQEMIKRDIKEYNLNRVVVASCSPAMHEPTYQRVIEEAGLNRYLFEMANLREQCSWAHAPWPDRATEKAKDLVRMAVAKARLLRPLEPRKVKVHPSALIIGGGVAGIRAALDLAERGFHVYIVERKPYLGGRVAQLNKVSITHEDAMELLEPMLKAVQESGNITVYTNSEVKEFGGYLGNFEVTIRQKPRFVTSACNACGKCAEVCPVEAPDEYNMGLSNRKAIYIFYEGAYPPTYTIDPDACTKCGKCAEVCPVNAINLNEQPREEKIKVGAIIIATGFDPYEPKEYGYGLYKDVVTQLQLERLLSPRGPTGGRLIRPSNGEPVRAVAFILCTGSRVPERPYCSRICCTVSLKNAIIIKKEHPDVDVYILYRDIRAFGKGQEEYYAEARRLGVIFVKFSQEEPPEVTEEGGRLRIRVKDLLTGAPVELRVDLVVLAEALLPSAGSKDLGIKLGVSVGPNGFFKEAHPKLRPLDTMVDGVFIAGAAQSPKDIQEAIVQASGAASRAAIPLSQGEVEIEPIVATVDTLKCKGCGRCEDVCEFGAVKVEPDERGVPHANVNEALCKGCGACTVICPTGAITIQHFRKEQLLAMVMAAVRR